MEAKIDNKKFVYPGMAYQKFTSIPEDWKSIFKDSDYSAIISGSSGSGKDSVTGYLICNDLAYNKTVIILDVKSEYGLSIFAQLDPVLRRHLVSNGLAGRGYKVNFWVPYVEGMDKNPHFKLLCGLHHPNLRIRPFRILKSTLVSEDTANMSLQKSALQSMASKGNRGKMKGMLKKLDEFKEQMGQAKLGLDDRNRWEEGCGWEYMNFEKVSNNKQINVITTYFMMGRSSIATVSFMIGIMNEFLSIGKGSHRLRRPEDVFSIVIPEVQIILPKNVQSLKNVVNTLQFSMLSGLLLMRSFGVRLRINLQNLSALLDDMLSQSRLFSGRTTNVKDLSKLAYYGVKKDFRMTMGTMPVGDFIDVFNKKRFNVAPMFHKARQNEYLANVLREYAENPAAFLFETPHGLLSEIVDPAEIGLRFPCTVKEYNRKVKAWIKKQVPIELEPVPIPEEDDGEDISPEDELEFFKEMEEDFDAVAGS